MNKAIALTLVYGPNDKARWKDFFDEITQVRASLPGPWLLAGDFYITKGDSERKGSPQNWKDGLEFMDFISSLNLIYLQLKERCFTWSNRRDRPSMAIG